MASEEEDVSCGRRIVVIGRNVLYTYVSWSVGVCIGMASPGTRVES